MGKEIVKVKAKRIRTKESPVKHRKVRNFKTKIMERIKPKAVMMIEMYHHNGSVSHLVILTKQHKFNYGGSSYVIDEDTKIWNNSAKMYMLRYHEGFALPFNVEVSANVFKKNLPNHVEDVSTSYNPVVLKEVLKFEYAKGVIQGAEVHEFIKRSFIIIILTLGAVLLHFAVNAYKSGWI